jgi:hypothetical protein
MVYIFPDDKAVKKSCLFVFVPNKLLLSNPVHYINA